MATLTKPKKARKPQTFSILFRIDEDEYGVNPLAAHPDVAVKAYRLFKHTGDLAVYDVRLSPEGHAECSCPGHTYHKTGKPCKHLRCLVAAGMLPRTVLQPVTSNEPF